MGGRPPCCTFLVQLAITAWGEGGHRALLLHGLSSSAAGWWRLGADLAAFGHRVIAPDLRGHGRSGHADDYRLSAYAEDVLPLGEGWDFVLGHSLGGAVAVLVAGAEPGWTGRLVLEDPALVVADTEGALEWLLEPFGQPLTAEEVLARNPSWHPEDARHKAEALAASGREVVRRTVEENQPWSMIGAAAELTVPTLLLGADRALGGPVSPELGKELAEANSLLRFRELPGAGHSIHRDSYEVFWEVLLEFIEA